VFYFLERKLVVPTALPAACSLRRGRGHRSFIPCPALPARGRSIAGVPTDPLGKVAHPTAGTGKQRYQEDGWARTPVIPQGNPKWTWHKEEGKNRIRINLVLGMCEVRVPYRALHASKLSGTEAVMTSGARFLQHPPVKNLGEYAGPSPPFPCTF